MRGLLLIPCRYAEVIKIVISGSDSDKYRISDDGPWITIVGDPDKSTEGTDLPCNQEGCLAGMLIMRFVSVDGDEEFFLSVIAWSLRHLLMEKKPVVSTIIHGLIMHGMLQTDCNIMLRLPLPRQLREALYGQQ